MTAILLLAAQALFGQSTAPPDTTCGLQNGRAWNSMDESRRLWFLLGISDGLSQAQIAGDYFVSGLKYGEVSSAITEGYRDTANVLIPVIDVLKAVKLRFEGTPQPQVEYALALKRRTALTCLEHRPKAGK